jgi:aldehyde dehydrogenase (NAD+)
MHSALETLGIQQMNNSSCIGGRWCGDTRLDVIESINPSDLKCLAMIRPSTEPEYQHIIAQSTQTFATWRTIPAPKRGEMVRRIAQELRRKKHQLGDLVALETGKIKSEADGEVQEMIDIADFAVGQSRMLYGKTMPSERPQHRLYEQWLPLGVVGIITAFNFPVAVWAWNAFIAVIAGNTVIWKPSPKTPLCAIAIQNICNQIMSEMNYQGVFSLFIPDDRKLLNQFVEDRQIPLISFTGSSVIGRSIYIKVASRLGKCLLELSGNNAVIVDESADINLAIPAIVFAAVGTVGQRCTSTCRLLVHEKLYDTFINHLLHAYQ